MRFILPLAAVLVLAGCTQAQIDRAAKLSAEADDRLAQVDQAIAQARSARDGAKVASDGAHAALEAAKSSQAAGGAGLDMLLAVLGTFVPLAGVAGVAVRKAITVSAGLRQTIAGIEEAKKAMTPEQVASLHGSLAEAQDDHVKATVSLIKANL